MTHQHPTPWIRWPQGDRGSDPRIAFGGDYNPEQWPEHVWQDDVRLMRAAGVNLVNVGIFSWGLLEVADGRFDFGWLDRVLDLLAAADIAVDLATATASPPAWLVTAHPEMLPVDARGTVLGFGGRQSWCPSSPVYRQHSLRLVEAIARRYADHPALALWHISNELGCHNSRCYCDVTAAAFQVWLTDRYGSLEKVNESWGTAFWSQHYSSWEQVMPPRAATTFCNPTQQLDFARFSSDALLGQLVAEREVLHRITPDVPVTTNFMVMGETRDMDYFGWGHHVDLVSNDHYLREGDPEPEIELAFSADLVRGAARGRPWMVMEQSTSAVNWGTVNRPKRPGELRRNSLAQVARGADAVGYFQWRASRAGAEKFHSAMLPHAGEDSRVFREVVSLGGDLQALAEVAGSSVRADVAVLFDWSAWWAVELDSHPSQEFRYRQVTLDQYRALWRSRITADVVPTDTDLDGYRIIVVPALYLVDDHTARRLSAFAEQGGTVVVTYFSGITDPDDHIRLGGYPGAFRDLLGVRVEEFGPLRAEESVALDDGTSASRWAEDVAATDAEVLTRFVDGPFAGGPAVTRRVLSGGGSAWYLATTFDDDATVTLWQNICRTAGVQASTTVQGTLETVVRTHEDGRAYLFAVNHGDQQALLDATGTDLLSGAEFATGPVVVGPGEVVVLRQS